VNGDALGARVARRFFVSGKRGLQVARGLVRDPGVRHTVFVAGVQRSGTNMMMDVLERSLDTDVYHERDERAFDGYEMRPPEVIHAIVERSPAPRVVVKALCELHALGALLDEFMPACAVWMFRDYDDVVNSHIRRWTGMPAAIGQIVEDRDGAAGWRGRGMSDETLEIVTRLHREGLDNPSACALFWYFRNALYFERGLDRDARVRLVEYERLVTDPEAGFRDLFAFAGLAFRPSLVDGISSSPVQAARRPEIAPAVRALCESMHARLREAARP